MHLNTVEIVFVTVAVLSVYSYLRYVYKSSKYLTIILLTLATLPPLILSADRATQFLTVDELHLFAECIELPSGISMEYYNQWNQGSFHTSEAIFSSIFSLMSVQHWNVESIQMLGKGLHWFGAILLVLWMHFLLNRYFIATKVKQLFYVIFINTVILFPTNALAFKIFQYDIYALMFGMIALLYIIISFKTRDHKHAVLSVITAALGAQEKMNVSPLLILSILIIGFHNIKFFYKNRPLYGAIAGVLQGFFFAMVVILCTFGIIGAVRHWNFPDMAPGKLTWPLIAYIMPMLRLIYGGAMEMPGKHLALFLLALSVSMCFLVSLMLTKLECFIQRITFSRRTAGVLLFGLIAVGVSSFYISNFYQFQPSAPGVIYFPNVYFNDRAYHFFSPSLWVHAARFIARSYELFLVAIPTVLWTPLLFCFASKFRNISTGFVFPPYWKYLVFLAFIPPLAIGLAQYALVARYLNLPLFVFALLSIIMLSFILERISFKTATFCTVAFVALLIIEIFPFKPLFGGPFRPIWAEYPTKFNVLQARVAKVHWPGWGEELMLIGQQIVENNNVDQNNIILHYDYKSRWLGGNIKRIVGRYYQSDLDNISGKDLFIFSRNFVWRESDKYFPYGVEPYMILQFRGHPQAWVFRGDQLKKAGYRFPVKIVDE